ncbi:MAG: GlcG/HbpS family heme-binding protein [Novosphingobium sp.]
MAMKPLLALSALVLAASPAATQAPAPAPPSVYGAPIALGDAQKLIERGIRLAAARNLKLAFAVVEPSGELVAFARMDGVPYASIRIAQQKARSAARLRIPTAELEQRVLAGRTVLLSSDEVIAVAGGVPISANGQVIGALGVSGASAAEDAAVATAVIDGQ